MNWLDFSTYENANSKFTAELSDKGGYVTFSNSGKGGNKKFFTLSLESFLTCLKDMYDKYSFFVGHESYLEKEWRDLGGAYYTDETANAQITVQTKPMFATLSKIIIWANSPMHDSINPEESIALDKPSLLKAIEKLETLSLAFTPRLKEITEVNDKENIIYEDDSIRDFAKYVFSYFFGRNWSEVLSKTSQKKSSINSVDFIAHDFGVFKRLIGEFDSPQNRENLLSSNTMRYFEEPIFVDNKNHYYFSTQWNGDGNYDLSFSNLKNYFESEYSGFTLKKSNNTYQLIKSGYVDNLRLDISSFLNCTKGLGLNYNPRLLLRFTSSLLTKPFVILTGLTGSGKTKIAQTFAEWICQDESQYRIVPVGADWTNREPLLGYPNGLDDEKYVLPDNGVLELMIQAGKHRNLPYFLILDEMNLSHVERYFADFLSIMESGKRILLYSGDERLSGKKESLDTFPVPNEIGWPENLFIIGTVNIDETTYMFSPKVLDRANVIEFRLKKEDLETYFNQNNITPLTIKGEGAAMAESFLELSRDKAIVKNDEIQKELIRFFEQLSRVGAEFGYRSAKEILILTEKLKKTDPTISTIDCIDIAVMQKLLPKLHGSRSKLIKVLDELIKLCVTGDLDTSKLSDEGYIPPAIKYSLSYEKLRRMRKNAIENGFASYAEA